jgi:hypothetical protein
MVYKIVMVHISNSGPNAGPGVDIFSKRLKCLGNSDHFPVYFVLAAWLQPFPMESHLWQWFS